MRAYEKLSYYAELEEAANKRGAASRAVAQIKRLPNGEFAPKGQGRVLRPGERVEVPHKSNPDETVMGTVESGGKVRLDTGPDVGQTLNLKQPDETRTVQSLDPVPEGGPKVGDTLRVKKSLTVPKAVPAKNDLSGGDRALHPHIAYEVKQVIGPNQVVVDVGGENITVPLFERDNFGIERGGRATPEPPKSPGTTGGDDKSEKKQKTAWSAYDKKLAEFQAKKADPDADKGEVSKLASQVRAAKWAIKRAGGNPDERPDFAGPAPTKDAADQSKSEGAPAKHEPTGFQKEVEAKEDSAQAAAVAKLKAKQEAKEKAENPPGKSPFGSLKQTKDAVEKAVQSGNVEIMKYAKSMLPTTGYSLLSKKLDQAIADATDDPLDSIADLPDEEPFDPEANKKTLADNVAGAPDKGNFGKGSKFGPNEEGTILNVTNADQEEGKQRLELDVDGDTYAGVTWSQFVDYLSGKKPLPEKKKTAGKGDLEDKLKASLGDAKPKGAADPPGVESYDPKKGPSDEQKAANAEKMGKAAPAKKDDKPKAKPKDDKEVVPEDEPSMNSPEDLKQKAEADDFDAEIAAEVEAEDQPPAPGSPAAQDVSSALSALPDAELDAMLEVAKPKAKGDGGVYDELVQNLEAEKAKRAGGGGEPANPMQAALEAYKAAGGNDPSVLAALGGAPQADAGGGVAGAMANAHSKATKVNMAQPGAPKAASGLAVNTTGANIASMTPGQLFQDGQGNQWIYHKPTSGGTFHIVKPAGGGKAKVLHGLQEPPMVGPAPPGAESAAPAAPAVAPTAGGDDLFDQLEKSVAAAQAGTLPAQKKASPKDDPRSPEYDAFANHPGPEAGPPPATPDNITVVGGMGADLSLSPGRGPTGKLRNFKAMGASKLSNVIYEIEQFGGDPEALAAAKAALAGKG